VHFSVQSIAMLCQLLVYLTCFRSRFVGSAVINITTVVYWHYSVFYDIVKVLISGMLGINCGVGLYFLHVLITVVCQNAILHVFTTIDLN